MRVNTRYKVDPDRPRQNGIARPSDGTIAGRLWALFDTHGVKLTIADAREIGQAGKFNANQTSIEFYSWRRFNGITRAAK